MDFGRLENLDGIDWTLPEDDASRRRLLRGVRRSPLRIRLAAPLWAHRGFVGKIYPASAASNEWLGIYAEHFDAIELNSTFYAVDPERIALWREAVPERFRFCPKIPRALSHEGGLDPSLSPPIAEAFRRFEDRLGVAWLQLPPSTSFENGAEALLRWIDEWPAELPLGVEFRHPGWARPDRAAWVTEELSSRGVSVVGSDTAGRRDLLKIPLSTRTLLLRLALYEGHESDAVRLNDWADRLLAWSRLGLQEAWVFLHHPTEDFCIESGVHLAELLEARGQSVRAPRPLPIEEQGSLFDDC